MSSVARTPARSTLHRTTALLLTFALALSLLPSSPATAESDDSGAPLVISQVYGGGGNSGASFDTQFVELLNRSDGPVSVDGLSLQYASATGTGSFGAGAAQRAVLPDAAVAPGSYFLVAIESSGNVGDPLPRPDAAGSMSMSASNGKIALVSGTDPLGCTGGSTPCDADQLARILDLVGYGSADLFEGAGPAPALNATTSALRVGDGCQDTDDNAADFTTASPPQPRNSTANPADCEVGVDPDEPEPGDPDPLELACQAPSFPVTAGYSEADTSFVDGKAITASATNVDGDVSFTVAGVSPEPEAGELLVAQYGADAQVRFSNDVPGLDPTETDGRYTVMIEAADDSTSDTCTVDVRVVPVLNLGELRGVVPDDANGRTHVSPYALGSPIFRPGDPVATVGVVTQLTLEENAGGDFDFRGFFVQSLDVDAAIPEELDDLPLVDRLRADGDERTSDGLWISSSTFPNLRLDKDSQPPFGQRYFPEVGDVVVLRGAVVESFQQTQMNSPFVVDVIRDAVDVSSDIEVVEADPPDDVQAASVYWERVAGMQVAVPEGSLVVSGNDAFAPSTSEFWVIRGDHPVAEREDPSHRRVFRPYHPLAHPSDAAPEDRIDQNGFRILLGSFGVKAASGDATELIAPARTGDTITATVQGGLYFSFSKYQVMVDTQPVLERGPDPSAGSLDAVTGFDGSTEYSVMVYNVENLYDFRSDPFSGCDLDPDVVGDGPGQAPGTPTSTCTADEPGGSTITPPFTYAPRSQAAYDVQREAIAEQILVTLEAPDIITIQEAEKQDVCIPVFDEEDPANSTLECDLSPPAEGETMANTSRGSGAPDTIEELAIEIFVRSEGAVRYEASGDAVNGRDVRGITQGFLHRTDRVELVPVEELTDDPVLGEGDAIDIPYPSVDERTTVAPWVTETVANPSSINAELADGVELADGGRFPQTGHVFTRGVQVGRFRIYADGVDSGGPYVDRYVTSNHMSAGPDRRVEQRTEQARLNAAVNQAIVDHGGRVLSTGDFNVFPRPDDPFPAFKTDPDREPSDQLGPLYERGFVNLHDVILDEAPENTYSFIFRGISQVLDHIFVDEETHDELVTARYIHINVDYPAEPPGFEPGRGASDHDPLYARFRFDVEEVVSIDAVRAAVREALDDGEIRPPTARRIERALDVADRFLGTPRQQIAVTRLTVTASSLERQADREERLAELASRLPFTPAGLRQREDAETLRTLAALLGQLAEQASD